jgi:hypothetical protein
MLGKEITPIGPTKLIYMKEIQRSLCDSKMQNCTLRDCHNLCTDVLCLTKHPYKRSIWIYLNSVRKQQRLRPQSEFDVRRAIVALLWGLMMQRLPFHTLAITGHITNHASPNVESGSNALHVVVDHTIQQFNMHVHTVGIQA